MPRITPKTLLKAYRINPLLPLLLPECRTIDQAKIEYKWLSQELPLKKKNYNNIRLLKACQLRFRHYPLQYILKTQPFGNIIINCKPGVLIPRWETEEWCLKLINNVKIINDLKVLDLCTGTGCIPILLAHSLISYQKNTNFKGQLIGVDVSPIAIDLAKENSRQLASNIDGTSLSSVLQFIQGDILNQNNIINKNAHFDIITCNPPYIHNFIRAASVRCYEPKLALYGNLIFYQNLIDKWINRTDSFIYEVGDMNQVQFLYQKLKTLNSKDTWKVGFAKDSNDQVRCVYGYKSNNTRLPMNHIFEKFGQILC
ncbi:S-adenosylmethionine-dependent methyltransferase SCDLUD_002798 [Saccharomycodes ludwigii]|uniref:S-adenosylmethionine-dependent methyltransferase n=1 Tax=Saccharomycodes ludwigii TaxID=36035 RepID=UPI001E87F9B9|nr:hypothetical protein SCDLUD_002798 [Saccharomycodes ludwigii]KAH3901307.1 hypothetical protein SCDLUD_002798 [Saccharomycodes ludwigii]